MGEFMAPCVVVVIWFVITWLLTRGDSGLDEVAALAQPDAGEEQT